MPAIPPNINLEGFKKSMCDGIDGAFRKGVIHGRYLLQEELSLVRCKNCEFSSPDPVGREDVLFCAEWERFTTRHGYCHKGSKRIEKEAQHDHSGSNPLA